MLLLIFGILYTVTERSGYIGGCVFEAIVGQEQVKGTLGAMLSSGAIPHSLLFAGPHGVGKSETALELARLLLCREGPLSGCSTCGPCGRAAKLEHPDLHVLFPFRAKPQKKEDEGKWSDEYAAHRALLSSGPYPPIFYEKNAQIVSGLVDEVRERLFETSFEGGRRICLVFSADHLNAATGNSLLKILEEPPDGVHFILTAERTSSVLPTIVSRSTVLRFRRLTSAEIAGWLVRYDGIPEEQASSSAMRAEGSLKRAREFATEDAADIRGRAFEIYERAALGSADSVIAESAPFLWSRDVLEAEDLVGGFARLTRAVLRQWAGCASDGNVPVGMVEKLAGRTNPNLLERLGESFEEGLDMLGRNVNISLVMTKVLYAIHDTYR